MKMVLNHETHENTKNINLEEIFKKQIPFVFIRGLGESILKTCH